MTNTHNIKMTGLKKAASETKLIRENSGNRVQISYERETGKVYSDFRVGCNSWVVYDDAIQTIGFAERPMTMQEIADMIAEAI